MKLIYSEIQESHRMIDVDDLVLQDAIAAVNAEKQAVQVR